MWNYSVRLDEDERAALSWLIRRHWEEQGTDKTVIQPFETSSVGFEELLEKIEVPVQWLEDAERTDVPPGRCGAPYPYAEVPYSCELLAGHQGMHQCNDWRNIPAGQLGIPQVAAWSKA